MFLFIDFAFQLHLQDGYQKDEMQIVSKSLVLIFFVVILNNNLISSTKSTQCEGIILRH